jgi:hypothetical protein
MKLTNRAHASPTLPILEADCARGLVKDSHLLNIVQLK